MIARDLLRVVVAQICEGVGYSSAQESACDLFVDIVQTYIESVGMAAKDTAELAGRTECNFVDVHTALTELETTLPELTAFARDADEVPCARVVPDFPARRKRVLFTPDDARADEGFLRPEHVPPWLPPFPDPATYLHTPDVKVRRLEPAAARALAVQHKERAEAALVAIGKDSAGLGGGPDAGAAALHGLPEASAQAEGVVAARPAADAAPSWKQNPVAVPAAPRPAATAQAQGAPHELTEAMLERTGGGGGTGGKAGN